MLNNMDYLSQHLQCSRSDKQDCLPLIWQLMELATFAHSFGILDLDNRINQDPMKYYDPFLIKAVSVIADIGSTEDIEKVLYTFIVSGNYTGEAFLKNIVITETLLALMRRRHVDTIFLYIVPSYFGMDFEPVLNELYKDFKRSRGALIMEQAGKEPRTEDEDQQQMEE